jgi:all-trans-retinol 13,14-reductase
MRKPKILLCFILSFPSAKDEEWQINNPGISTIQIMIACSYDRIKKWEQTKWMKRGEEYNLFKEQLTKKMLKKLYEIVPQVNGHVVMSELSTPLSTKHFSNYQQGEIYGLEHTPARFRLNWLRPQSPFKNLYLTGQDTLTVGVGGALFSGVITASTILKKNFMSKIDKYNTIKG